MGAAMAARLLWIEESEIERETVVQLLAQAGIDVVVAERVAEAERLLDQGGFDLVILDVMMPIEEEDEARGYGAEGEGGMETGLVLLGRMSRQIFACPKGLMVVTMRLEDGIRDKFIAAGVPPSRFFTKYQLRDAREFRDKVLEALS